MGRRSKSRRDGGKRRGKLWLLLFGLAGLGVGVWVFRSSRRSNSV